MKARRSRASCALRSILFCNNNQWAISTPLSEQTAAPTLADKAIGYGMPGVRVDGGDVLAVYEATRDAVARARAGDGPTFIEAVSYRAAPHATADDPSIYIDPERVEEETTRTSASGASSAISDGSASSPTKLAEAVRRPRPSSSCAPVSPPRRQSHAADPALVFEHAYADPPRRRRTISPSSGGCSAWLSSSSSRP